MPRTFPNDYNDDELFYVIRRYYYNKQSILWMFYHLADYAQIEYNQGPMKEEREFIKYMAEAFFCKIYEDIPGYTYLIFQYKKFHKVFI